MRAQFLCKFFLVSATADRDRAETHLPRKLDTKMSKATNALHSDQISAAQAGVAESVVGRDTRAEEWSRFRRSKLIGDRSDAARFSDHHFRISSIHGYSRYHGVLTIHHVSSSARFADSVFTAEKAHADALTDFPSSHRGTQRLDTAHHFVPRNSRQTESSKARRVTVAASE